jgi:hypothetical protein
VNFIEFAGFIAMLLFLLHSARNTRRRKAEQEDEIEPEELEQAQRLKDFLRGIDSDMKPSPVVNRQPPKQPPKPLKEAPKWEHASAKQPMKPTKEKSLKTHVEAHYAPRASETAYSITQEPYKDPYAIKRDAYAITERRKSGAFYLKKRLKSPQDMILWHEIVSPPLALRNRKHMP